MAVIDVRELPTWCSPGCRCSRSLWAGVDLDGHALAARLPRRGAWPGQAVKRLDAYPPAIEFLQQRLWR
jgi:hypothetical protein